MNKLIIIISFLVVQCLSGIGAEPETDFNHVLTESKAKRIARDAYAEKMGVHLMAEEGIWKVDIQTIGFDIPGFAKRGDQLWEARVMAFLNRETRAIIWVNANTEQVYYVIGPWK